MSNNIINVPLRSIAAELGAPVGSAVLGVSAFTLVLAISLPLTGWLGDRYGRKRVLALSLALMVLSQLAAAIAPNLPFLIVTRALQGLACSAIPPIVMGMLIHIYPAQRSRMMGAWAAANGIGQAVGPPVGGIVSDLLGWRSIFFMMATASATVLWVIATKVPSVPRRDTRLHLAGAVLLTTGTGLVLAGTTAVSQPQVPYWLDAVVVAVGLLLLVGFGLVSRGNPDAMIPLRYIFESRFARSSVAAFAQMFVLGTCLVAIPLYLTGPLDLSTSLAGTLFFALPITMALLAPAVGRLAEVFSPRTVLRVGLVVVIGASAGSAWLTASLAPVLAVTLSLLVALGAGMAMVQTPAATGATRSPAGAYGAALGLFNLTRFSGMTAGAAWVALLVPRDLGAVMWAGCAFVALAALLLSFAGPNPPAPPSGQEALGRA
jgi:MFS family permease